MPSTEGPMTMPATISSTTEGSRTLGKKPSTRGAAKATATTIRSPPNEGMEGGAPTPRFVTPIREEGVSLRDHDLRGDVMAERWFSDDELSEMSRPTMDRAIEAIEAGDLVEAKALCEAMKHEWRFLHD